MESYSDLLSTSPLLMLGLAALLGLMLGSFLNVVIARLPLMLEHGWHAAYAELQGQAPPERKRFNLATPRSHCPHCQHPLRWAELIPLVSWCWQRARCQHCGHAISWQYPAIELASAALAVACLWGFGWQPYTLAALGFCLALLALTAIDLRTLLLPDDITQPLLWAGLLVAVAGWGPVTPAHAILGASAGYLALWLLANGYQLITGREGMGQGDFKLLAALGAWLGPLALPSVVLIASVLGLLVAVVLIVRRRANGRTPLPFGPCLAAAGLAQLFAAAPGAALLTFG